MRPRREGKAAPEEIRMGTLGRFTLIAALALLAGGCATNTRNDFDPAADFSKYHTYGFLGGREIEKTGLLENSLVRQRVEGLVARQLDARGLRRAPLDQGGDLEVLYWVGVKDKQEISTVPRYGYEPYWSGRWGPVYDDVVVTNYREGTLIIDLLDARTKNLVWRTYLVRALSDDPEKNLRGADKDLQKAFLEYPPAQTEKSKQGR